MQMPLARMRGAWPRRAVGVAVLAVLALGCAAVPQNRRRHLADPTMQDDSLLEAAAMRKMHVAREGAGGGDGAPAGGGCGCSN